MTSAFRQAWAALDKHYQAMKDVHMRSLFEREPSRFDQFSMQVGDIFLDYSKNRATAETMELLMGLAAETGVCEKRDAMFRGVLPPLTNSSAPTWHAARLRAEISRAIPKSTRARGICRISLLHACMIANMALCVRANQASSSTRRKAGRCYTWPCATARTARSLLAATT